MRVAATGAYGIVDIVEVDDQFVFKFWEFRPGTSRRTVIANFGHPDGWEAACSHWRPTHLQIRS
jgi:hypothetical protein